MRWLAGLTFVAASMLAWPDVAFACKCGTPSGEPLSPAGYQQWLSTFDGTVFQGAVVSVRTVIRPSPMIEYTFKVERAWKGVTASEVVIRTPPLESACGVSYQLGMVYVIAAEGLQMSVDLCSLGYFHARNEKDFISALGGGLAPTKDMAVAGQRSRWAFVEVQPESISPDGPRVTMRNDGSAYLVRLISPTGSKTPLSARKAQAWILRAEGAVVRRAASGPIPDPVENVVPGTDILAFSFEYFPLAELVGVVVSLDGNMTVHKVLPP